VTLINLGARLLALVASHHSCEVVVNKVNDGSADAGCLPVDEHRREE
jgi:hypothetical protein